MKNFWVLVAVLAAALLLRGPSLFRPHFEMDEVIYETLAEKVANDPADYSLRGTEVLKDLEPTIYDKVLFHHPPLFVFAFSLVRGIGRAGEDKIFTNGIQWFRMRSPEKIHLAYRSYGGAGLCLFLFLAGLICTAAIGKILYDWKTGIIACAVLAVCPISWLCSTKIWIDNLLFATVPLAILVHLKGAEKSTPRWSFLSGLAFGLAMLSKYTAIAAVPTLLAISAFRGKRPITIQRIGAFLVGFLILFLPWVINFYQVMGVIYPDYIKPNEEIIRSNPFMANVVNRPFYFYGSLILLVSPLYLLSIPAMIRSMREKRNSFCTIWALSFLIIFTLVGITRGGYQARFLLPALPAFAILAARLIASKRAVALALAGIFGIYCLLNGYLLAIKYQAYDADMSRPIEEIGTFRFYDDPVPILLEDLEIFGNGEKWKKN